MKKKIANAVVHDWGRILYHVQSPAHQQPQKVNLMSKSHTTSTFRYVLSMPTFERIGNASELAAGPSSCPTP